MDIRIVQLPKIRILRRPGQGFRALVERAPQAEAFTERVFEKLRPYLTLLHGARRRLATAAVCIITVWLFVHVTFGANGMVVYREKRADYHRLQKEIDSLQNENDRYTGQIKDLKTDPRAIEKEAREQLHYTRPGEVIYVAPAPSQSQSSATNAARK
ncbi:MAG TPA: septum formation initiator family protein [Pyrinomonadaceae bacterium]|jgi:cell division protein FtsB|nr:septum formation initiator family protein [Pyrinomonadaceae bacterium]